MPAAQSWREKLRCGSFRKARDACCDSFPVDGEAQRLAGLGGCEERMPDVHFHHHGTGDRHRACFNAVDRLEARESSRIETEDDIRLTAFGEQRSGLSAAGREVAHLGNSRLLAPIVIEPRKVHAQRQLEFFDLERTGADGLGGITVSVEGCWCWDDRRRMGKERRQRGEGFLQGDDDHITIGRNVTKRCILQDTGLFGCALQC